MLAVKYRQDFPQFPELVRRNVDALPEGYTDLMSEGDYNLMMDTVRPLYESFKTEQAALAIQASMGGKFKQVRQVWQDIADEYAGSNAGTGITSGQAVAIADSFSEVEKYLRLNVPSKALIEIDNIVPIEPYLPASKLLEMKTKLGLSIQSIFSV
jgi:hypothetical protein